MHTSSKVLARQIIEKLTTVRVECHIYFLIVILCELRSTGEMPKILIVSLTCRYLQLGWLYRVDEPDSIVRQCYLDKLVCCAIIQYHRALTILLHKTLDQR